MNDVLLILCKANVSIMYGWLPYSARSIAENLGITIHQARYQLNKLRKQGLVTVITETIDDEDGYLLYKGWHITKKAEKTDEYKTALEIEREICKSVFDIEI